VFLGVLVGAIWLLIAFGAYHEAQRQKFDVSVHPGNVTYGTHSTAVVPMVSVSTPRSSVPMISGNTVRSYAYSGHATMPVTSSGNGSGYKLHTLSSATLHSIGGGGSGGGGGTSGGSVGASKGISYSGSFSVPTLALVSPTRSPASDQYVMASRRRAKPGYDGQGGDEVEDGGETWYWDEDEEDWVNITPIGTVRENGGYYEEWDGEKWVRKGQIPDLGTPIGDIPWIWMLLLLALMVFVRKERLCNEPRKLKGNGN